MRYVLAAILLLSVPVLRAQEQKEYILLSGGPALLEWEKFKSNAHDRWWGNFIRPAVERIMQIREKDPQAQITWLVYRPSYARRSQRQEKQDLISNINSLRTKYKVNLVWFDRADQVVNYLNYGRPRDAVKIANFEYFGHSNRACFMFDYSNEVDSGSKSWLHEDDLNKIHRGLFTKNALVKSWGCYTGESMSSKWRSATGKKMIGAIGKTDYAHMHNNGWLPTLSEGGRWGG